jgi:signal peptidase
MVMMLLGVRIFGLTPYTVLSGSMEPTYHVGSVIYVKDIDPSDLREKDPVTFRADGGQIVTHRIIEVLPKEGNEYLFRTQGDANNVADGVLEGSRVIGKPIFTIPYLGYITSYVQSTSGLLLIISLGSLMLLGNLVPQIITLWNASDEESNDIKDEADTKENLDNPPTN